MADFLGGVLNEKAFIRCAHYGLYFSAPMKTSFSLGEKIAITLLVSANGGLSWGCPK
jgi:hypothetical protein